MKAVGIILSNIHDKDIPELTSIRSIASVPFGGRYRLIDFALSNMVNSGITTVGIVTKSNYQSLMDHVGSGKEWDLVRKNGGLFILPPFSDNQDNLYQTRLQALSGIMNFLQRCEQDYVVIADSNMVCNIDLNDVMDKHEEQKADITCIYKEMVLTGDEGYKISAVKTDVDGRVVDISTASPMKDVKVKSVINMWVFNRPLLINLIRETLSRTSDADFDLDMVGRNIDKCKIVGYAFEGYFAWITSLAKYFRHNMDLLKKAVRDELLNQKHKYIYTKIKDSAPTSYRSEAKVKNSFIADGCVIDGVVENSVIFRGVTIGRGSVVKNCILMQDSVVMDNVSLNCVIADKNVLIKHGRNLSGCESLPFFINKNSII